MKKSDIFNKGFAVGLALKPLHMGVGVSPTPPVLSDEDIIYHKTVNQFYTEIIFDKDGGS